MIRKTASALPDPRRIALAGTVLLLAALALVAGQARAQTLDAAELEDLVAPIALYPDDVLGIILPASTFPLDIVRAARFLDDLEQDPSLTPDESWDDSIVALLNYPEVLRMMNEDLDWTWALGEAVLTDEGAVLAAAQDFRQRAYDAGNLRSDDRQVVSTTEGAIEIRPADPEVVYIPVYEPREVIVYHASPYYYSYYPFGYPVYYYPYPIGYSFNVGFFWGVTSYFSLGWHSHHVHVHHHSHYSHPYYMNSYYFYQPYYYRTGVNITVTVDNYPDVWRPSPRRGARPRTETIETRTSTVRTPRTATTETQPGGRTRTASATTRPTGATTETRTTGGTNNSSRLATGSSVRGGETNSTTRRATGDRPTAASGASATPGAAIGGVVERSPATPRANTTRTATERPDAATRSSSSGTRNSATTQSQTPTRRAESSPATPAPRTNATGSASRPAGTPPRAGTSTAAPRIGSVAPSAASAAPRSQTATTVRPTTARPSAATPRTSSPATASPTTATPRTSSPVTASPTAVSPARPAPATGSGNRSSGTIGGVQRSAPSNGSANSAPRVSGTTRSSGGSASSSSSSRRSGGSSRP